jgi:hypothetical protein
MKKEANLARFLSLSLIYAKASLNSWNLTQFLARDFCSTKVESWQL